MVAISCRLLKANIRAAAVLSGLLAAACAPLYSPPQQVQASNPNVTYKYHSDQELLQANQNAATYCNRFQSVHRTARFGTDPDGSKVVIFDCVQSSALAATPTPVNPNLTYNYGTDQELLDASRSAQTYCMRNGSQQVISNIVTNANGTRTVTFQCGSR
ncbi:MAG: hypothetical protein H7840_13020 [Alphaproteobacteria bacterium]